MHTHLNPKNNLKFHHKRSSSSWKNNDNKLLQLDVSISILMEISSCNLQFFSEWIATQLRILHGVTTNSLYLFLSPCKATNIT